MDGGTRSSPYGGREDPADSVCLNWGTCGTCPGKTRTFECCLDPELVAKGDRLGHRNSSAWYRRISAVLAVGKGKSFLQNTSWADQTGRCFSERGSSRPA